MSTIYSNNETVNINPADDLVLYKEEFINSRIEKFLYAICALDFNDLPNPLSRIEELYKCLATGLPAPTFVPQSRVEKYLMAILGGYDTNALPAPQSRTEVLLNKILLGDTDLSDIEWLKSRYEFLLAYIAKSGETSSGPDVYYVDYSLDDALTTLYNTIEHPVKNAILKGQTLVNLIKDGYIPTSSVADPQSAIASIVPLDGSKEYTIILNKNLVQVNIRFWYTNGSFGNDYAISSRTESGYIKKKLEIGRANATGKTLENIQIYSVDANGEITNMMLLEGDYTNVDIPYFTGMKSVKMPVLTTIGKNLSDRVIDILIPSNTNMGEYKNGQLANIPIPKGQFYVSFKSNRSQMPLYIHDKKTKYYHYNRVEKYLTTDLGNHIRVGYCHNNVNMIIDNSNGYPYMTLLLSSGISTVEHYIKDFMISSTSDGVYEPHKSNILTCNEEVELRGIGNGSDRFEDELNLVTGELTQRIGEIVLDGSEKWETREFNTTNTECVIFTMNIDDKLNNWLVNCDKFNYTGIDILKANNIEGIYTGGKSYSFFINVSKTKASTVEEFKNWLSNNNITVQYPLIESVKTVDLSTLDQDGKETKLKTFDDITHVTVSSEGLVPTGEITVATKNATDMIDSSVMSLRMNDILKSQSTLEESANAQSDDIDVAMIGTTDIYEQLL